MLTSAKNRGIPVAASHAIGTMRLRVKDIFVGHGFRRRGMESSRVEGFSDAVFGFALTLLVVSLEVPRTFGELKATMQGFIPFAICFVSLITVWFQHCRFFRRYGLEDGTTVTLNAVLLFVVLFYVYPLKFLFTLVSAQFLGKAGQSPSPQAVIAPGDAVMLMVIYGTGFIAVNVVIALMLGHAYRLRHDLELSEREQIMTAGEIRGCLLNSGVGLTSIAIVLIGGARFAAIAGWTYMAVGFAQGYNGWLTGSKVRRLQPNAAQGQES